MLLQNLTLLKYTMFHHHRRFRVALPLQSVSPGKQYFFFFNIFHHQLVLPILGALCNWTYAQDSLLCPGSVIKDILRFMHLIVYQNLVSQLMRRTTLYSYTTSCSWLSPVQAFYGLLYTFSYKSFYGHMFSFSLGKCIEVKFLCV